MEETKYVEEKNFNTMYAIFIVVYIAWVITLSISGFFLAIPFTFTSIIAGVNYFNNTKSKTLKELNTNE